MAQHQVAQVFNRSLKRIQKNQAASLASAPSFEYLRSEVASRLVDRVQDIQRDFPLVLDLGSGSGFIARELRKYPGLGKIDTLIQCDLSERALARPSEDSMQTLSLAVDEEYLPFRPQHFDLILSSCSLHWVNDLPQVFQSIRECLKPDGVFLGAMLGGETLQELRSAFILADQERMGGVDQHLSPFAQVSDVGNLISSAGLTLPTVDTDVIQVDYANVFELMEHLQGMGEQHAPSLALRSRRTSRTQFLAMAAAYQELYGNPDGSIRATFQIIYMIGWAPERSQPRPLERGSASHSLRDIEPIVRSSRE